MLPRSLTCRRRQTCDEEEGSAGRGGEKRKKRTNGAVAAHLSEDALVRDLRRPLGEVETLRNLIHRLGQCRLRNAGRGRDEEELDSEGAAASTRGLRRLRTKGDEDARLLETAVGRFGGEGDAGGSELTVGRNVVVERVGSRRRNGSEDLGGADGALLRGGENAEAAAGLGRRGGRCGDGEGRCRGGRRRCGRDAEVDREGETLRTDTATRTAVNIGASEGGGRDEQLELFLERDLLPQLANGRVDTLTAVVEGRSDVNASSGHGHVVEGYVANCKVEAVNIGRRRERGKRKKSAR